MLLTVAEVARLLASTERQIYRWVDEAEIPFQLVRGQVRFNRTELFEWATTRRLPVSLEAFDASLDPDDRTPSLARAIRAGGVHLDVVASDRDSALRAVVERTPMPDDIDREFLVEVLVAREKALSTAVGNGIAIPHVKQPVVAPGHPAIVSVSHLRSPVAFGATDGNPVRTIFLLVTPTVRAHLQVLARVARSLLDPGFRAPLDRCAPTEELARAAEVLEAKDMAEAALSRAEEPRHDAPSPDGPRREDPSSTPPMGAYSTEHETVAGGSHNDPERGAGPGAAR